MDEQALLLLSYGMYIVSAAKKGKYNGQVANSVFQVCANPPMVAVCINKQNLTHEYIRSSNAFSISILQQETPMAFIGRFGYRSGRDLDKFDDIHHRQGRTGTPIVTQYAVGYLEAEVTDSMDAGTHTLFLGRVVEGALLESGDPMTYAFYRHVKGGKSPKTAPTYTPERT